VDRQAAAHRARLEGERQAKLLTAEAMQLLADHVLLQQRPESSPAQQSIKGVLQMLNVMNTYLVAGSSLLSVLLPADEKRGKCFNGREKEMERKGKEIRRRGTKKQKRNEGTKMEQRRNKEGTKKERRRNEEGTKKGRRNEKDRRNEGRNEGTKERRKEKGRFTSLCSTCPAVKWPYLVGA
jgi:hypothetical protein